MMARVARESAKAATGREERGASIQRGVGSPTRTQPLTEIGSASIVRTVLAGNGSSGEQ
jgi:hypothetical protein